MGIVASLRSFAALRISPSYQASGAWPTRTARSRCAQTTRGCRPAAASQRSWSAAARAARAVVRSHTAPFLGPGSASAVNWTFVRATERYRAGRISSGAGYRRAGPRNRGPFVVFAWQRARRQLEGSLTAAPSNSTSGRSATTCCPTSPGGGSVDQSQARRCLLWLRLEGRRGRHPRR